LGISAETIKSYLSEQNKFAFARYVPGTGAQPDQLDKYVGSAKGDPIAFAKSKIAGLSGVEKFKAVVDQASMIGQVYAATGQAGGYMAGWGLAYRQLMMGEGGAGTGKVGWGLSHVLKEKAKLSGRDRLALEATLKQVQEVPILDANGNQIGSEALTNEQILERQYKDADRVAKRMSAAGQDPLLNAEKFSRAINLMTLAMAKALENLGDHAGAKQIRGLVKEGK
jgi:hypothetical protein